jgi:hypothetical protein
MGFDSLLSNKTLNKLLEYFKCNEQGNSFKENSEILIDTLVD